jgi:hypothetical protein
MPTQIVYSESPRAFKRFQSFFKLAMELIDGNAIAASLIAELKQSVATLEGRAPCLALVRIGEDPASVSYVRKKKKLRPRLVFGAE